MIRRPPISPRTVTLFPYPALFRSGVDARFQLPQHRVVLGLGEGGRLEVGRQADVQHVGCLLRRPEGLRVRAAEGHEVGIEAVRSEEHTSELQSLMRISYAVICLKKTTTHIQ